MSVLGSGGEGWYEIRLFSPRDITSPIVTRSRIQNMATMFRTRNSDKKKQGQVRWIDANDNRKEKNTVEGSNTSTDASLSNQVSKPQLRSVAALRTK